MCAHHATPPAVAIPNPLIPATNCSANQYPKIKIAGTGIRKIKKNVNIRWLGNITAYAPITPLIAPLAPSAGIPEPQLNIT